MTAFYRWDTKAQMVSWRMRQGAAMRTGHKRLSYLGATRTSREAQLAARAGRNPGSHAWSLALCSAGPATARCQQAGAHPSHADPQLAGGQSPGSPYPRRPLPTGRLLVTRPRQTLCVNCRTPSATEPFRQRPLCSSSAASVAVTSVRGCGLDALAHWRAPAGREFCAGELEERERESVTALRWAAAAPRAPGSRLRPLAKSAER